jgi:hypothetical protein
MKGFVRPRGRRGGRMIPAVDEPKIEGASTEPVPPFQLVAKGDPPRGHNVRPISVIAAQRRGPAFRARHRRLLRDGAHVVEQVRPDVRRRYPPVASERDAGLPPLAPAPRREIREDEWRDGLPMATVYSCRNTSTPEELGTETSFQFSPLLRRCKPIASMNKCLKLGSGQGAMRDRL